MLSNCRQGAELRAHLPLRAGGHRGRHPRPDQPLRLPLLLPRLRRPQPLLHGRRVAVRVEALPAKVAGADGVRLRAPLHVHSDVDTGLWERARVLRV